MVGKAVDLQSSSLSEVPEGLKLSLPGQVLELSKQLETALASLKVNA